MLEIWGDAGDSFTKWLKPVSNLRNWEGVLKYQEIGQ